MSTEVEVLVDPVLFPLLAELSECVCNELATNGGGPTCWCGLWPGSDVSWEYCGECGSDVCGMGWVRLGGVFPYTTFPQQIVDPRCERPLAMSVEVGALRCLPQPPDGQVAGPDLMAVAVAAQTADAFALYRALKCCAAFTPVAIEQYQPMGPQGGCVGGLWTAYVDTMR